MHVNIHIVAEFQDVEHMYLGLVFEKNVLVSQTLHTHREGHPWGEKMDGQMCRHLARHHITEHV
jgi:hypothetical protein